MDVKMAQERLSAEEYNRLIEYIELTDIYLADVQASKPTRELPDQSTFEFGEEVNVLTRDPASAAMEVLYSLKARSGRRKVVDIKAKYVAEFTTSRDIPEEFFVLYNALSLPLQTFPYFRELANSLFSRMGLPPLVLPLRKHLMGDGS